MDVTAAAQNVQVDKMQGPGRHSFHLLPPSLPYIQFQNPQVFMGGELYESLNIPCNGRGIHKQPNTNIMMSQPNGRIKTRARAAITNTKLYALMATGVHGNSTQYLFSTLGHRGSWILFNSLSRMQ